MRKQDQKAIEALFGRAVEVKRTPKMQQLETAIQREADRRGRYTRSIGRRLRHGVLPQEELEAFIEDKRRSARELAAIK